MVPSLPPLSNEDERAEVERILKYVTWDASNGTLNYNGSLASH